MVDLLGSERAAEWSKGHYGFINVWRPLGNPINSAPFGFVHPASVAEEDWLLIDLIYPDRGGLLSIAHSAVDMVEDPKITTIRKSIESRTLVRYDD